MKLVIIEGAQINAVAFAATLDETENAREEVKTGLGLVGQHLDVAEMGNIVDRFGLHACSSAAARFCRSLADLPASSSRKRVGATNGSFWPIHELNAYGHFCRD